MNSTMKFGSHYVVLGLLSAVGWSLCATGCGDDTHSPVDDDTSEETGDDDPPEGEPDSGNADDSDDDDADDSDDDTQSQQSDDSDDDTQPAATDDSDDDVTEEPEPEPEVEPSDAGAPDPAPVEPTLDASTPQPEPEPTPPFELVTRNPTTGALPESLYNSRNPAITPDGRFVVFESSEPNLVTPATNGFYQIFVFDRKEQTLELVSVDENGVPGAEGSFGPRISDDGCFVVFQTRSVLATTDSDSLDDVYLRDRCAGSTQLVGEGSGEGERSNPDIAGDGSVIAYRGNDQLYLFDRSAGEEVLISEAFGSPDQGANGVSGYPSLSSDGTRVAFWSFASNLVETDSNGLWDIFVYDAGGDPAITLASVSTDGVQREQGFDSVSSVSVPHLSANGRFVSFATSASNLVAGDTNDAIDVFVHDTESGTTLRAGVGGSVGSGAIDALMGEGAQLSGDGNVVAFTSNQTALTGLDEGRPAPVLYSLDSGETDSLISLEVGSVGAATISDDADGCFVAFFASEPLDPRFASAGVFVHDRCGSEAPTPSEDGGAPPSGTPSPDVDRDFEACLEAECSSEVAACAESAECTLLVYCYAECDSTTCQDECTAFLPEGVELASELLVCGDENCQ